jgi:hypothetical protein
VFPYSVVNIVIPKLRNMLGEPVYYTCTVAAFYSFHVRYISMENVMSRKYTWICICVVTLENPETSRREFWHLKVLRYQLRDDFLGLFISVFVGISSSKTTTTSTNYTHSMNSAHIVPHAPLLSQNARLGNCDEIFKSLMRQSLLFSHVTPTAIKKAKCGGHRESINL